MDACGRRLRFAMGAALLLVGLNVILVMSGGAEWVYGNLPGMVATNSRSTETGRYAGFPGSRECNYAGRVQQGSAGSLPQLAEIPAVASKAC